MRQKEFIKFRDLKEIQKAFDIQVKEQALVVINTLKRSGFKTVKYQFGTFSLTATPQYLYSKETLKLKERLEGIQEKERESGKAKVLSITESVRYTAPTIKE